MDPTRFQGLDDVQLAILLSLVAQNHCLVTTDEGHLDQLQGEIERIATEGFGLPTAIIRISNTTTPDEFISALFIQEPQQQHASASRDSWKRPTTTTPQRGSSSSGDFLRGKRIWNVIIARDLDLAPDPVQMLALELIRNKAITTKQLIHQVPSPFLLIGLVPKSSKKPKLNVHLADHFFISHYHDPSDENDGESETNEDQSSLSSSIIRKAASSSTRSASNLLFSTQELGGLTDLAYSAHVAIEIKRYIHDIIVFLRMHRAVAGGISAKATKDFELVVKCLCPLNGLEFATPSLVELAVYKVYGHRIDVADKKTDRSIMWGSRPEAVERYLAEVDPGMIIDDVLDEVRAPL